MHESDFAERCEPAPPDSRDASTVGHFRERMNLPINEELRMTFGR